jgi:hypothetical protein
MRLVLPVPLLVPQSPPPRLLDALHPPLVLRRHLVPPMLPVVLLPLLLAPLKPLALLVPLRLPLPPLPEHRHLIYI